MTSIKFSKRELERYSRHLLLPEFNIEGQRQLKAAKVLVVGAGGLGSPLLLYLAAAGVGKIGIVDFDIVEETNLQRQVLFSTENIGQPKVEAARDRLLTLNPHIEIEVFNARLTPENALDIIKNYDVVADGTDNFPTRYLVNDACVLLGKTNVYASIFRFEGQVSVFNFRDKNGERGVNYRDLFPEPPPPNVVPNCAEGGVLGVLPGIIGSLQASEVVKVITGIGEPLSGRLFLFDALDFSTRTLKITRQPNAPKITQLMDYQQFCGVQDTPNTPNDVKEMNVHDLKTLREMGTDFQLIDVRLPYEYDIVHLDGELIPLETVGENAERIARNKPVIFYCRSGKRSVEAVRRLQVEFGLENLYSLKGGVLAYAKEIDDSLAIY